MYCSTVPSNAVSYMDRSLGILENVLLLLSCLQVTSVDGSSEIGKIYKQWSGFAQELFTDAANFGIRCKDNMWFIKMVYVEHSSNNCMQE